MAEATNELAFVATGLYGKPLAKQNGAPLRLVVPWKYGFKSIKSIQRITFTDDRPATFWNTINDRLYGFWANVNPDVPFPDWSQKEERLLGERGKGSDAHLQRLRSLRRPSLFGHGGAENLLLTARPRGPPRKSARRNRIGMEVAPKPARRAGGQALAAEAGPRDNRAALALCCGAASFGAEGDMSETGVLGLGLRRR